MFGFGNVSALVHSQLEHILPHALELLHGTAFLLALSNFFLKQ